MLFRTALLKLQEPFVYQIGPFALSAKDQLSQENILTFHPMFLILIQKAVEYFPLRWNFFQHFGIISCKVIRLFLLRVLEISLLQKEIKRQQWQSRSEETKETWFFAINSLFSKRHAYFKKFIRFPIKFCFLMRNTH